MDQHKGNHTEDDKWYTDIMFMRNLKGKSVTESTGTMAVTRG